MLMVFDFGNIDKFVIFVDDMWWLGVVCLFLCINCSGFDFIVEVY